MTQNILWVDNTNDRGQAAKDFAEDVEGLKIEWVHSTTPPKTPRVNCVAVLYHVNDIKNNCANEDSAWQYVKKWLGEKPSREVLLFSGDFFAAQSKVKCLNQNSQSQTRWSLVSEPINNPTDVRNWLNKYWDRVVNGNYHATGASLSGPCILAAIAVSLWPSAFATKRFPKLLKALKREVKTMQSDTAPCQRLQELLEKLSQASAPDGEATLRERQQTLLREIVESEGKLASASTSETHDL